MAMKTVWFWKGPQLDSRWAKVANFATDEYPIPSTIETDVCPTISEPLSFCELDSHGNLCVTLLDEQFSAAPDLWFVLEEVTFPTELVTLHAMTGGAFPKGTVIAVKDIRNFSIKPSDRVGYVKWFKKDSRIQQVAVAENWRRMRISTVLFGVADIVIVAGDYGKYLNGGDITTSDGENLRQAWSHSSRVSPRIGSVENAANPKNA
jgi:hypothetical protein